MRNPNFFIVGAPKCGTTALSEYLRHHRNVFVSTPKEPHYFAYDFASRRRAKTLDEYLEIFSGAQEHHLVAGEASVWYLFSQVAIREIMKFNPVSKIIAMVRNPVDMVHSLHSQFRYNTEEDAPDFESAWRRQNLRAKGVDVPKRTREAILLQYGAVGKLGGQIDRALKIVPRAQMKIIVLDDFIESPKKVYEDVLSFLSVPSDGRQNFPRINPNKQHANYLVGKFIKRPPATLLGAAELIKRLTRIEKLSIIPRLQSWNTRVSTRTSLRPEFRRELAEYFRGDIEKLSVSLGRDLSHWAEP